MKITQKITIIAAGLLIFTQSTFPQAALASIKKTWAAGKQKVKQALDLDGKLINAVKEGNLKLVKLYLALGADPEWRDDEPGFNALDYAKMKRVEANLYNKQKQFDTYGEIITALEAAQAENS